MAGSASSMLERRITLSNGMTAPQIQLGLYMMSGREVTAAVPWALAAGYRAFDSAQIYHNEREAGAAIKKFLSGPDNTEGLTREDIFYTSKLASNSTSYAEVRRSIKASVAAAGLGYIDLFLLHSPYGGRQARLHSWKAVEDAITDGEVKMGGVSNFGSAHIEELMASHPRIKPVINQIEVHPFNTQTGIRKTSAKYGLTVEAYAPLVRGMRMKHPTITKFAQIYKVTPAQLLVRWSIQHNMITLPKSSHRERVIENADVGRFSISDEHMAVLDELDENLVTDWDPTDAP